VPGWPVRVPCPCLQKKERGHLTGLLFGSRPGERYTEVAMRSGQYKGKQGKGVCTGGVGFNAFDNCCPPARERAAYCCENWVPPRPGQPARLVSRWFGLEDHRKNVTARAAAESKWKGVQVSAPDSSCLACFGCECWCQTTCRESCDCRLNDSSSCARCSLAAASASDPKWTRCLRWASLREDAGGHTECGGGGGVKTQN
jgi:hypothetical protein